MKNPKVKKSDAALEAAVRDAGGVAGVLAEVRGIGSSWNGHRACALLRALAAWAKERGVE